MPIGKNAIKRVENNGYSKVASKAPDMENSSVIANVDEQVMEKIIAPIEKKASAKKCATKKSAPATPKKTATVAKKTVEKAEEKNGFERVEVGEKMPYYLL